MHNEQRFIWPHCHAIDDDGTIFIKGSLYEEHVHCSVEIAIDVQNAEHGFYAWLIQHSEYQRVLTEAEVSQARDRFDFELGVGTSPS